MMELLIVYTYIAGMVASGIYLYKVNRDLGTANIGAYVALGSLFWPVVAVMFMIKK